MPSRGRFIVLPLVSILFTYILTLIVFLPEWYWKCVFCGYIRKLLSILAAVLSILVVWSEVTFFNKRPVLSIFAIIVNVARDNYDYLTIEVNTCTNIPGYWTIKNFILVTLNRRYFILVLLRLFYRFKNKSVEFVLLSTSSPNQRIQFNIFGNDVVSTHPSVMLKLFGLDSHG